MNYRFAGSSARILADFERFLRRKVMYVAGGRGGRKANVLLSEERLTGAIGS